MDVEIVISGVTFHAPLKYSEGHTITANEAAALNSLFHSDLQRSFKKRVEGAKGETGQIHGDKLTELKEEFKKLISSHDFSPKTPGNSFDPIEREAIKLAIPAVRKGLVKKGFDPGNFTQAQIEKMALDILPRYPKFREEAMRRFNEMRMIAEKAINGGES